MGIEPLDLCPYEPCAGPQTPFGCSKAAGLLRHRSATEAKLYIIHTFLRGCFFVSSTSNLIMRDIKTVPKDGIYSSRYA